MTSRIQFDKYRCVYVGQRKILSFLRPEDFGVTKKEYRKMVGIDGRVGALVGVGEVERKTLIENPLTAEVSPLTIRAHAGKIIQEIQSKEKPLALEESERGLTLEWVTHKGVAASCIRSHDDFRSFIDPESAPLMALWSFYIPDKSTSSDLTLVVLHGTANGNLYSHDLNELPTTRAGSQTEALVDYLWSEDLDLRGAEEDFKGSRPHRIAQGLLNMLGMEDELATSKVEALFRVSYDEPLNPPLITFRSNSESSKPTKSRITRLVIGSPIVVQSVRKPSWWRALLVRVRSAFS